jgi:type II secretory ATPase GspE/PulE/Tfp pilus assembly ATPase PilB-like protein
MPGDILKTKKQLKEVLPPVFARSLRLVPLEETRDTLEVGIHGEGSREMLDLLSVRFRKKVIPREMTESEILEKLQEIYGDTESDAEEIIQDLSADIDDASLAQDLEKMEDLLDSDNEAPIIRLLNRILARAVQLNASDIHLEPEKEVMRIRFRVDGIMSEKMSTPLALHANAVSRLKIMADLNIAERRLPQDGRFQLSVGNKNIDVRMSTIPTVRGEKVVLRLLDQSSLVVGLEQLGFLEDQENLFRDKIKKPYGIIILTGPTGSGKTTTLYAALNSINSLDKNIVTLEDPVELCGCPGRYGGWLPRAH